MKPLVSVIMGSTTDWEVLRHSCELLAKLQVPFEHRVVSAHRTPDLLFSFAAEAEGRGLRAIIAGAGGAAHLPGMVAAKTLVPVFGVPVPATLLNGVDSLLSIVQMPGGIPVGTLAIGKPGAINAAIMAAQLVGQHDPAVLERLRGWRAQRTADALASELPAVTAPSAG